MSKKLKEVPMPVSMAAKAQNMINSKSLMEAQIQGFFEGCMEGLGLEGDWNLDTKTWVFKQVPKPKVPLKEDE